MEQVSSSAEEAFRRHKQYFLQYVEAEESSLVDRIRALADSTSSTSAKRLLVDLNALRVYDGAFTSGSFFLKFTYPNDIYKNMNFLFYFQ